MSTKLMNAQPIVCHAAKKEFHAARIAINKVPSVICGKNFDIFVLSWTIGKSRTGFTHFIFARAALYCYSIFFIVAQIRQEHE